jgi:hypothetical protein
MPPMPGYELTEPWLTEEGLPKKGIWDVVYYAGGGHGRNGCKPMPKLRRALLQLVSARVVLVEWCFVLFLGVDADCGQKKCHLTLPLSFCSQLVLLGVLSF